MNPKEPKHDYDRFELRSGEEIWNMAKESALDERTEYWIFWEPSQGDAWNYHGPYKDAEEARQTFMQEQPSYNGAGLVMERIVLPIGVNGRQLVYGAQCEVYANWGEETPNTDTLKECSTRVAVLCWDYVRYNDPSGEGYYTNRRIEWSPEFLKAAEASSYVPKPFPSNESEWENFNNNYENVSGFPASVTNYGLTDSRTPTNQMEKGISYEP